MGHRCKVSMTFFDFLRRCLKFRGLAVIKSEMFPQNPEEHRTMGLLLLFMPQLRQFWEAA